LFYHSILQLYPLVNTQIILVIHYPTSSFITHILSYLLHFSVPLPILLLFVTLQPFIGLVLSTRSLQTFLLLTIWLQFLSFSFFNSSLHLFFCRPLALIPIGFQSVVLVTSFIFYIPLRCPNSYILCAFMCLTLSSPCINFCSSLVLFILHPSFFPVITHVL
jgi:hypothetical protein